MLWTESCPLDFRQKQWVKRLLVLVLIAFVLILSFVGFRSILSAKVSRSKIHTSIATIRTIEATITASGTVIPEYEEIIISPIEARIEKVFHNAGETVDPSESILKLDKESTRIALDNLNDELEVKRNKIYQLKLNLEKNLIDLQAQNEIKKFRLKSLETTLDEERKLFKIGGASEESVEQAALDVRIARLELEQNENQISNQKKLAEADLKTQNLEISIQDKNIRELERKMKQAEVTTNTGGVITWVEDRIGTMVKAGDQIAQVADLSSFKVEGKISDSYVDNLRTGSAVIVKVNDTDIRGKITNIQPEIDKGIVKFIVALEERNHKLLRSNMQVDVFVVTSYKDKAIAVKNGPVFNGSSEQKIFVINANEAEERIVKVGVSNFDFVEILTGVKAGEEVIVSDLADFANRHAFEIEN